MSTENSPYLCLNYACHACIILKRRQGTIKRTVHASAEQYIDIVSLWWYVTIYRRFWILLYYNEVWVYKMFPGFKGCITKKWCHFVNLLDLTPLTTSPSWSSYPHYWRRFILSFIVINILWKYHKSSLQYCPDMDMVLPTHRLILGRSPRYINSHPSIFGIHFYMSERIPWRSALALHLVCTDNHTCPADKQIDTLWCYISPMNALYDATSHPFCRLNHAFFQWSLYVFLVVAMPVPCWFG